jgi:hypothetical protein
VRLVPLVAGGAGIAAVLVNRVVSGVAPVVSASSSQSRADVLIIVMSAVLLLTGLQWLSLRPRDPEEVELDGSQVSFMLPSLETSAAMASELVWCVHVPTTGTKQMLHLTTQLQPPAPANP